MAPWRNWIAHLITNQEVTGSNLVGVTLAENWLKLTDSPLFVFAISIDSKGFTCDPDKIRTCNLLIRNQVRYPIAPQSQVVPFWNYLLFSYAVSPGNIGANIHPQKQ